MSIKLNKRKKQVLIEKFLISNPEVYRLFESTDKDLRESLLGKIIEIGAFAMERATTKGDVDYIQKEFNKLLTQLNSLLEENFDPSKEGSYFYLLNKKLKEYFSEGGTFEDLIDIRNKKSPLRILWGDLVSRIRDFRDSTNKTLESISNKLAYGGAREELIEETTLKGYIFEDIFESELERLAKQYSDSVENVSQERGINGSMVGDFIVHIYENPDLKIVFETKNTRVPKKNIIKILNEAMENRHSQYGILVVASKDQLPREVGHFRIYSKNKIACAFSFDSYKEGVGDILEVAYKFARFSLLFGDKSFELDKNVLEESIEKIKVAMGEYASMLRACTQIKSSADSISEKAVELRGKLDRTRKNITDQLNEIMDYKMR